MHAISLVQPQRARNSRFFLCTTTPTPTIYTISLHDALPISSERRHQAVEQRDPLHRREPLPQGDRPGRDVRRDRLPRSEEHTSELQSHVNLVCRLLLEKKKYYENGSFVYCGTQSSCADVSST